MLLSLVTCFYFVHHKQPVTGKTAVKTKSRMVARGSEITPSSTSQIWWSSILHQSPARLAKPCKITGPWFYFYCHALAKTLKGFGRCNTRTHTHTKSSVHSWFTIHQRQLYNRLINQFCLGDATRTLTHKKNPLCTPGSPFISGSYTTDWSINSASQYRWSLYSCSSHRESTSSLILTSKKMRWTFDLHFHSESNFQVPVLHWPG